MAKNSLSSVETPNAPAYNTGTVWPRCRPAGASCITHWVIMRSLRDIAELFPNSRKAGLTDAEVAESRAKFGANRLTPLPREPVWKKFLEKFDEPIIKILLAAALLSMFVEMFRGNAEGNPPVPGSPLAAGLALVVVA